METVALAAALPPLPQLLCDFRRLGGSGRRLANVACWLGTHMRSDGDGREAEQWIAAIATRGDHAAFAALFGFYAPRIKGFLVRTGTPVEVAEEIAQETMLSVWRKAAMFDVARASVTTWIYTIARNLRIDRQRHEGNVGADAIYEALRGDDPARPDEVLASAEREDHLRAAMRELPREQMTVVQLSFFEDRAHGDIARVLGIPLGTVKSRLRLALAKLRQCLDETI